MAQKKTSTAKKTALKKVLPKKSVVKKTLAKKAETKGFSFNNLLDKKHRPLHAAGIGTVMVFLQGLFAVLGVLIIAGAVITYIIRATKNSH